MEINLFFIFACRPGDENIILPLHKNVGYQSATATVLAQRNPAYGTKEDIHTYDYIPGDGMMLTRVEQFPPELPPDRSIKVQDANNESKSWVASFYFNSNSLFVNVLKEEIKNADDSDDEGYVNDGMGPPGKVCINLE